MKKIVLLASLLLSAAMFAQNEPKFVRDAAVLNADGTLTSIPTTVGRLTALFSVNVKGLQAETRISKVDTLKIIIKGNGNQAAPVDKIRLFKMQSQKAGNRSASMGAYGIPSKSFVPFKGDSYGESSYIIVIPNMEPGEYGIWYIEDEFEKNALGDHAMSFFGID